MFSKILIANRGEIACRVIRTARRMGIATVAVYSDADAHARHVRLADEAVHIGLAEARQSYLVADRIIAAARRTGAQAIHPGYGFLSENVAFCRACDETGIVFIGPPVAAIEAMGSKSEAKRLMESAGVPLTPGYHGECQEVDFLRQQAEQIGFPVLIKASSGGGGKGMRLVERAEDFAAALASCQREAQAAFGDARVLVEKYVVRPRHIEIQVFGDSHGNYVYLFERDCSVQRRHQKVLEEAPAPGMTGERRARMGQAAVDAARAVGYVGAGTVEFIAHQDGTFYFMEMNTRLQVEHPVTEKITGLDLVEWQLRIASGEPLPLQQPELRIHGHALEARIYAEDPQRGFLPSTGRLVYLRQPEENRHVRIDSGVETGDDISAFYDPMIAKLIVWDETREQALARMRRALSQFLIGGVSHNISFLSRLVGCSAFTTADLDTSLIEREQAAVLPPPVPVPQTVWYIAALAELLRERELARQMADRRSDRLSPWDAGDGWRLNAAARRELIFQLRDEMQTVQAVYHRDHQRLPLYELACGGAPLMARGTLSPQGQLRFELEGYRADAAVFAEGVRRHVFYGGDYWLLNSIDPLYHASDYDSGAGGLTAPMPGKVIALLVTPGDEVEKGAPLLILEAMKMEHTVLAPASGTVNALHFQSGDQVEDGVLLLDFSADTAATGEAS